LFHTPFHSSLSVFVTYSFGRRRYSSDPSTFSDRFVHLTNAAIQREHTTSSAAEFSSTHHSASASQQSATAASRQQEQRPEHLDFLFPNDPSLAGGSKISLAQWRLLMTDAGICHFKLTTLFPLAL
jgi:hypothetical protein